MLQRSLLAVAALSPLLVPPAFAADYDTARRAAVSVVRVVASTAHSRGSFGSGVVIPGGRVATNCHVTRGASGLSVVENGARADVLEQLGDPAADVCVLRVGRLNTPAAALGGSRGLQIGDEVTAVGFGGGLAKSISPGKVTALFAYRDGYVIRTTAAFRQGASGGALFDREGRLVGLITFFRRGADGFAFFAVPVEWIDQLPLSPIDAQPAANPFWMLAHAEQPHFLQVATLESDHKWQEMVAAARDWVHDEPDAAPAWEALGRALISQGERAEGSAALERAQSAAARTVRANLH